METVKKELSKATRKPGHYYNIAQLRTELWTELKLKAYSLTKKGTKPEQEEGKVQMLAAMKTLREVEQYFAFPGNDILDTLSGFIRHDEFQILKNSIKEILRLLVSEDFRQDPEILSFSSLLKKKDYKGPAGTKSKKRYFEVLFVDNLSTNDEQQIAKKLSDVRDPKEPFIYQLVFAKSFQDSIIALKANPNIQACIVRSEIPFRSKNTKGLLKSFVSHSLNENYEDYPEYDLGILLGEAIKQLRPEVDIYYVTDTAVQSLPDNSMKIFERIF
ncbi:MAG: hypothetical protein JNL53_14270, partial [Cyclobacteriaceae bacterium]|nr:hypothetical protein [Cyclobacteriaceae bacterium]